MNGGAIAQAALWDEVKDKLKKVVWRYPAVNSSCPMYCSYSNPTKIIG